MPGSVYIPQGDDHDRLLPSGNYKRQCLSVCLGRKPMWFVPNLPAVAWSACVSMMKMVIEVVKMEWDYLRAL